MNVVLSVTVEIIRRSTIMLFPIIPDSCEKILSLLNIDNNKINFQNIDDFPTSSSQINNATPIFPRIEKND
jgi:methionyl-tRNA synthetase